MELDISAVGDILMMLTSWLLGTAVTVGILVLVVVVVYVSDQFAQTHASISKRLDELEATKNKIIKSMQDDLK